MKKIESELDDIVKQTEPEGAELAFVSDVINEKDSEEEKDGDAGDGSSLEDEDREYNEEVRGLLEYSVISL